MGIVATAKFSLLRSEWLEITSAEMEGKCRQLEDLIFKFGLSLGLVNVREMVFCS